MGSKQFVREFIEILRHENAIWQIKSDIYRDRNAKQKSWEKLTAKYKEYDRAATIEMAKKKYHGIRASYRRELQKIRKSEESGADIDELYIPSLWYFDNLDFLRDQESQLDNGNTTIDDSVREEVEKIKQATGRRARISRDQEIQLDNGNTTNDDSGAEEIEKESIPKKRPLDDSSIFLQTDEPTPKKVAFDDSSMFLQTAEPTPKKKAFDASIFLKTAVNYLKKCSEKPSRDAADIYGESWAVTYRKLDSGQKIFAKRLIDDALTYAQLGQLSLSSSVNTGLGNGRIFQPTIIHSDSSNASNDTPSGIPPHETVEVITNEAVYSTNSVQEPFVKTESLDST